MHAVLQWCYWVMANSLQPIDCSPPGSSVHVFPGKNNGELPFPTPRNLLYPGIEPVSPWSPALAGKFFTTSTTLEALYDIHAKVFKVIFPINICSKYICIFAQMPHIQIHVKSHLSVCVYYCCSVAKLCPTLCKQWSVAHLASLSITIFWSLLKLMFVEPVLPSNLLILCRPLLLLPSIFSSIRVFSNKSVLHIRLPKFWSFNFSISPSNEYSELTSFRIDWFGLFAVQATLRSLVQHHSSKASIIWCTAFFMVQLSHPYMTNGKSIALTRWTFAGKVMSLLFNMLSRLVSAFFPRRKCL